MPKGDDQTRRTATARRDPVNRERAAADRARRKRTDLSAGKALVAAAAIEALGDVTAAVVHNFEADSDDPQF